MQHILIGTLIYTKRSALCSDLSQMEGMNWGGGWAPYEAQ